MNETQYIVTMTYPDGRKEVYENGRLVWSKTPTDYVREMKELGIEMKAFTW